MDLTPDRWRTIRAVFDRALEHPEEQRERWIAEATAGDPELRREVESLLAALSEEHDRFERPAALSLPDLAAQAAGPVLEAGGRVGPYLLLRQVGEGGMGVVFEAYRDDDQYRKRVAIKTISLGRNSELILRRFRSERQILARLEHPNIAALLDAGVTESNQPYFVMEFVAGFPIDQYCRTAGLSIPERLRLFRQICGAVAYAHRNLVIHRDLKPSNILVTPEGTVKLLDFGIAKLLGEEETGEGDPLTQAGAIPLTTAYASPEQVRGDSVTTATDVFSLGVVLYRLLTERHPFEGAISSAELRRRIVEEAVVPPSVGVARPSGKGDGGDPGALRRASRTLQGDLDSIVLMALRKESARRYSSVEQLSADVERYLAGRPVLARPDAFGYRFGKFVRRNRTGVFGGAAAALALLAGLGATMWQARKARDERDRAQRAAQLAELERTKAERLSLFLQNMLGAADPSWYSPTERPGPETPIRSVFDAAGRRAETELAGQPAVLGDVLRTLGRANQALRRLDLARPQLERARELHILTRGPASRDVAIDDHELGQYYFSTGELAAAERAMRQALATFRAAGDTLSDHYGRTLGDLGIVLSTSGRPAAAEPLVRASAAHRHWFDSTSVANAILLGNLGLVLSQQGKLAEADTAYRAALAAFDRFKPREYFERGYTLGNLAVDLLVRGQLREALPLAREQIDFFTRLLGPGHPAVGYGWINLARVLHAAGEQPAALEAARKGEALFQAALSPGHPDHARPDLIQGQILSALGQPAAAERRLRNALAIRRAKLAPGSSPTADVEYALGALLARDPRNREAESLLVGAYRTYLEKYGRADPRTLNAARALVTLYEARGKGDAALPYRAVLPGF